MTVASAPAPVAAQSDCLGGLPAELVYCITDQSDPCDLLHISRVSRMLRTIACKDPRYAFPCTVWGMPVGMPCNPFLSAKAQSRMSLLIAANLPISLSFKVPHAGRMWIEQHLSMQLALQDARLVSLSIETRSADLVHFALSIIGSSISHLVSLHIAYQGIGSVDLPPCFLSSDAPRLRHISLAGVQLPPAFINGRAKVLSYITTARLQRPTSSFVLDVLEHHPRLRSLWLSYGGKHCGGYLDSRGFSSTEDNSLARIHDVHSGIRLLELEDAPTDIAETFVGLLAHVSRFNVRIVSR